MQFTINNKEKSQKEILVTISKEEMELYAKKAAAFLGKEVEVKGFRRGKAPENVVREYLGESKIWERAAEDAFSESYQRAVRDNALAVVSSPAIEVLKLAPHNEFIFKAVVPVFPVINLPDVAAIAKEVYHKETREVKVEEKEVEDTLLWLRRGRAKYTSVSRPAAEGDVVEITYESQTGGAKEGCPEGKKQPIVLGKGHIMEKFDEEVTGLSAGAEKNFSLVVPESYAVESLRGRTMDFHVKVENVQEQELPALDDAFAKSLGDFNNIVALKKSIQSGLATEKEKKERERLQLLALKEIARVAHIEVPDVLIKEETVKMQQELEYRLSDMGLKLPDYLRQIKKTLEELHAGWSEQARERVEAALILAAIAEKEHIEVADDEVEKRANDYLRRFANSQDAEKELGSEERFKDHLRGIIRNEKVLSFLDFSGQKG